MSLTLSPELRRPAPAQAAASRRRSLWIAGSVALHALALWAVLQVRRPDPAQPIAPSYDLVFDDAGGSSTPPTSEQTGPEATPPDQASNPAPQDAPPGAAPQQLATAPPAPDATPPPAPGPATKPDTPGVPDPAQVPPDPAPTQQATAQPPDPQPPEPPLPAPEPPVQQAMASPLPVPPPPEPPAQTAMAAPAPETPPPAALELAPPTPTPPMQQAMATPDPVPDTTAPPAAVEILPPSPPPPAVRLALPDPLPQPAQPRDLVPDFTPPAPPAPLPPLPVRPRPAPPRPQFGSLGAPMDLNFGPAASRAPAPRPPGSRGIDFSLGAPKPGPNRSEAFFDIRAKNIGADWAQSISAYGKGHIYYPQQAVEAGEDGSATIQFVVDRSGKVNAVELKRSSGSQWLDMATLGMWRNAKLPPIPAENQDPTITVTYTLHYILIRR